MSPLADYTTEDLLNEIRGRGALKTIESFAHYDHDDAARPSIHEIGYEQMRKSIAAEIIEGDHLTREMVKTDTGAIAVMRLWVVPPNGPQPTAYPLKEQKT